MEEIKKQITILIDSAIKDDGLIYKNESILIDMIEKAISSAYEAGLKTAADDILGRI